MNLAGRKFLNFVSRILITRVGPIKSQQVGKVYQLNLIKAGLFAPAAITDWSNRSPATSCLTVTPRRIRMHSFSGGNYEDYGNCDS